jgi:hypothetical protein
MIGTCARCGRTTTGEVPIAKAGASPRAFVCYECVPDVYVPYVGGPLEGSYTPFPRAGLVLDGVYDECPIVPGTNQAERYVLRRGAEGDWAFVYAGPAS